MLSLGLRLRPSLAFLAVFPSAIPTTSFATTAAAMSSSSSSSSRQRHPFQAPPNLKGLFVGSGSDGLNEPQITRAILDLTEIQDAANVNVLYLGTATYDLPGPRERQTRRFLQAGCKVTSLDVVAAAPTQNEIRLVVEEANVIVVSGGNTLYAVDRWKRLGVDKALYQAMMRGTVLTGGSAGAICWFQGGHSDSADPDTFKKSMLVAAAAADNDREDGGGDESSAPPKTDEDRKAWDYIRVEGLGFLPGLVCPHHDKTQSNGLLRAADFESMILRHPTELGIGIDHWAALEVNNGRFRVVSVDGKPGSVLEDGTFSSDCKGVPGIWIKKVDYNGEICSTVCPDEGRIESLLYTPTEIVKDARVDQCRKANPDDGPTF